jgi:hypothetical protein
LLHIAKFLRHPIIPDVKTNTRKNQMFRSVFRQMDMGLRTHAQKRPDASISELPYALCGNQRSGPTSTPFGTFDDDFHAQAGSCRVY